MLDTNLHFRCRCNNHHHFFICLSCQLLKQIDNLKARQLQIWKFFWQKILDLSTCLYSNSCEMLIDAVSLLKHNIQIVVSMNNETWSYSLLSPSSDPSQWSFSSVSRLQNTFQTEQNHWWCQCKVSTYKNISFYIYKIPHLSTPEQFPWLAYIRNYYHGDAESHVHS